MKNISFNKLFLLILTIALSSFLTPDSGKLFIDNETGSSQLEHVLATHDNGTEHEHLRIGVGSSGGKDIVMEESGRLVLGSPTICLRYADTTYLAVEGGAFKRWDSMWNSTSDKRLKKNISPLKKSRDKFLGIKIYRFTYKKSQKVRYGIMAQEVKKDFPHSTGTFWENGVEYYTFNPSNLFFMGMRVIQENSREIVEQTQRIEVLETENQGLRDKLETQQKEIEAIKTALANLDVDLSTPIDKEVVTSTIHISKDDNKPKLQQNIPNPFQQSTTIPYYLPEGTRNATLLIHDMTGKTIAKHTLATQKGEGEMEINMDDTQLRGGTYTYSLYVNDQFIDTKKMTLLTK